MPTRVDEPTGLRSAHCVGVASCAVADNYLWHNHGVFDIRTKTLEDLSPSLLNEINVFTHRSMVQAVPFFKNVSSSVVQDIMARLQPEIYLGGDYIIHMGEPVRAEPSTRALSHAPRPPQPQAREPYFSHMPRRPHAAGPCALLCHERDLLSPDREREATGETASGRQHGEGERAHGGSRCDSRQQARWGGRNYTHPPGQGEDLVKWEAVSRQDLSISTTLEWLESRWLSE